jgi:hypothetical protein
MAQTVGCNLYHSMAERLCRWPLLNLDRLAVNKQTMTYELVSNALGVPTAAMTEAVRRLQDSALIRCRSNHIEVLDLAGLVILA